MSDRRRTFLRQVEQTVCRDRHDAYGSAEDSFADTAAIWSVVLKRHLRPGARITAADVGVCMAGLKTARYATSPDNPDTRLDGAGYWVCVGGLQDQPDPVERAVETDWRER